ncbi:CYFA0S04e00562g1_1 [Cyberlindnera fabianii]|uniref:Cap-associated protein CAF20 n=1 Tax=Cyberlindnera fabianii TaxID=36022 RepID=A0A061ARX9_CYBFA|nr:Cap-associated protein CAF20 [Cyberlindnera fabianii]CDR39919.1 CYFA0S04e00562g1_1 [Cyberlindnera fabianii]
MVKYTEEQLVELRSTAVVPTLVDFEAFTKAIEEQRLFDEQHADEHAQRRRSSAHGTRPVFRYSRMKPREKVFAKPDEDGWFNVDNKKKKGSISGEEATTQRDEFRETVAPAVQKKKLAATMQVDSRDLTADKPKKVFNAFAALDSEEDESDEDED